MLLENTKVHERTRGFDPERDWFSRASWQYQCGLERHANIHLLADDVPNFLRSFLNQYAVDIMPGEYTFREHTTGGPPDKIYEESCFLERFRNMLVMEDEETLWLARATPRAWLEQGRKITVKQAPSHFGPVSYEIVSDEKAGRITATARLAVAPSAHDGSPPAPPSQGREAQGGRGQRGRLEGLRRRTGVDPPPRGRAAGSWSSHATEESGERTRPPIPAGSGHSSNLSVSAISSAVSARISMFRRAPRVSQVAKPSGWFRRVSIRVATRRSW